MKRTFFAMKPHLMNLFFLACALAAQPLSPVDQAGEAINKNDLAAAEAALAPLTGADSSNGAAFFQLGNLRTKQRRVDDAVAAFERATKLDATKPDYFSQYAIALSMKIPGANFIEQATLATKMKKAFEKSVALDPKHIPGLIGLARYYSNAPEIAGGSLEKASEFAQRVKALNPFNGELELADVAERGEDFAAALAHFEAAGKLKPDHAGCLAMAGRMLAKLDRKAEARERFEAALKLDPMNVIAKKGLAEVP